MIGRLLIFVGAHVLAGAVEGASTSKFSPLAGAVNGLAFSLLFISSANYFKGKSGHLNSILLLTGCLMLSPLLTFSIFKIGGVSLSPLYLILNTAVIFLALVLFASIVVGKAPKPASNSLLSHSV